MIAGMHFACRNGKRGICFSGVSLGTGMSSGEVCASFLMQSGSCLGDGCTHLLGMCTFKTSMVPTMTAARRLTSLRALGPVCRRGPATAPTLMHRLCTGVSTLGVREGSSNDMSNRPLSIVALSRLGTASRNMRTLTTTTLDKAAGTRACLGG